MPVHRPLACSVVMMHDVVVVMHDVVVVVMHDAVVMMLWVWWEV